MGAIRFFDKDGKMIYESASKWPFFDSAYRKHEILLQEGEQIVGFVSSMSIPNYAWHNDF